MDTRGSVALFPVTGGPPRWSTSVAGRVVVNPVAADLDGDATTVEVLIVTEDGRGVGVHLRNGNEGHERRTAPLPGPGKTNAMAHRAMTWILWSGGGSHHGRHHDVEESGGMDGGHIRAVTVIPRPLTRAHTSISSSEVSKSSSTVSAAREPAPAPPYVAVAYMSGRVVLWDLAATIPCRDEIALGEPLFASILVEDLDGSGYQDLVVSTMTGGVHVLRTHLVYDARGAVRGPSLPNGAIWHGLRAVVVVNDEGGLAHGVSEGVRDVLGRRFAVHVALLGGSMLERAGTVPGSRASDHHHHQGFVGGGGVVTVTLEGITGGGRHTSTVLVPPGGVEVHHVVVNVVTPAARVAAGVVVTWRDAWGMTFEDSGPRTFHLGFYRLFKWMLAGPTIACALVALLVAQMGDPTRGVEGWGGG